MDTPFLPSSYTVLVVDSDPHESAALKALLERSGYQARTYHSGEALLQELPECSRNCCLISEVELPGMTGLELISRLRQDQPSLPALILTRLGDVPTAVHAMRSKVADYLTKPYVERDLIERLRQALLREGRRLH